MIFKIPDLDTKAGQVWFFSLMFKLCAIWPLDKMENWHFLKKFVFIISPPVGVIWMCVVSVGQAVALLDFPYNLFLIGEQGFVTLESMATVSLYLNLIYQKDLIYTMLSKMDKLPEPPKKRSYKTVRSFGKVYLFIYCFNTLAFGALPLFVGGYKLPASFWYFKQTSSPAYEIIYILEYFQGIWMIPCNVVFDFSFVHIVKFLEAQLDALADRFESVNSMSQLISCLKLHQDLLSIIEDFKNYLNPAFVGLFFFGCLEVCLALFEIIMMESFDATALVVFMIYSLSMSQFFVYCWYGSKLVKMMDNISDAAYFAKWYDFEKSERMALLVLIHRAQIPFHLRASFLCIVDMKTFTTILQESLSYAMVLRQLQSAKN